MFLLAIKPDTQDYYSFFKFKIRFQLARGTSLIMEIEGSVRKNPAIEDSVLYLFLV